MNIDDASAVIVRLEDRLRQLELRNQELTASEERYRTLVTEVNDGIAILDEQGVIRFANRALVEIHGLARAEDLVGRSFLDFVAPEWRARSRADFERSTALGEAAATVASEIVRPDGTRAALEVKVAVVREAGRVVAARMVIRDITERRRAEAAVEESRRRYEELFENNPVPAWEEDFSAVHARLSEAGLLGKDAAAVTGFFARDEEAFRDCVARVRVLDLNRACLALHGARSRAELLEGLPRIVTDESRAARLLQFAAVAGGRTELELDSEVRTLDGRPRDVHLRWAVLPGHERTYGRVLVTVEDITARKQAEIRVERLSRLYATLSQVNQAIVRARTREELFPAICRAVVEHGQFMGTWIGLFDPAAGTLTIAAACGKGDEGLVGTTMDTRGAAFEGGILARAMTTGRLTIIGDLMAETASPLERELAERDGVRAAAAVPFRRAGEIAGLLAISSDEADFFAGADLQSLLSELASDLSFALDAMDADAQRWQAEMAQTHARAVADATIQSLPGIFYLFTAEGRFVRWNEAFEAVSGYTGEEVAGLHPLDLFAGEDKELIRQRIGAVFAEGTSDAEAHFVSKDGTRTPYYFTGRRLLLDGRPHLVGVGVDLTARRRAEQSLRDLAHAVNTAGDVVFLTDRDGIITQINEQFTALYGYAAEDAVGKVTPRILKSGKHPLDFYQKAWARWLNGETIRSELVNRTKDGRLVDIENCAAPFHDAQGNIAGFMAIHRDITARKRAEAERHLLQAIALGAGEAAGLDDALAFVLKQVCETTGWALGEAWLPNRDRSRLECHRVWHGSAPGLEKFREQSLKTSFGPGEGLPGMVWQTRRPLWIDDFETARLLRKLVAAEAGLRAAIGVPVLANGEVVLVLAFFLREPGEEDAQRVEVITAVAAQIGELIQRKDAQAKLAASEAHFRTLIENASDLLTELDAEGIIRMQGPSSERLLGYRPDELVGHSAMEWVHPEDAPRLAAAAQRALATPQHAVAAEYRFRHRDGSWCALESIGRVIHDPAGKVVIVVNSRDVTERRRLEAHIVASERMASMGMLAAGVAHEINNPLAAVIANLDLATKDADGLARRLSLPPDLGDELRDARDAAERMRVIMRDLRIFARAEEERTALVDVRQTIESAARMAWNAIRHHARIEKTFGDVPPVEANDSRLGQVFLNLLVNAAQAIPEGHADSNVVRISTRAGPADTVVVEIADTGTGMTPEVQARLFDPFFTTKPAEIGTGLGLAICQRIVTEAGGRIEVESAPGKGSTFRVILPAARDLAEAREAVRAPEALAAGRRGRVLVIDDEEMLVKVIQRMLRGAHDVVATTSAREALDRISAGERFDVILCDVMMPVMSGIEFLEQLERLLPGEGSRVVFLTGGAFTPQTRTFLDRSPNRKIDKPFDAAGLCAVVAEHIR